MTVECDILFHARLHWVCVCRHYTKAAESRFHIFTLTLRERTPRTLNPHFPLEPREAASPGLRPPSPPVGERGGVRGFMGWEHLQKLDVNRSHEPVGIPLNRSPGTFSPTGGEGRDEGARFMGWAFGQYIQRLSSR